MLICTSILLPIITGLILPFINLDKKERNIYVILFSTTTSILSIYTCFYNSFIDLNILSINNVFTLGFKIDGLSKIFLLIISILWPIATLYATEYMDHEKNQDSFFRYYLIAYGIALGITFSKNAITMYLFYELLTFLTLPLIMHDMKNKKALYAGKVYLIVSILGASIALMGIIILTTIVPSLDFIYGGVFNNIPTSTLINISYILCFIGFGVKAAILPFTFWLPTCGVAPTPVSALLHAVAVVKAGVFAIMRMTYYIYGVNVLRGTSSQKVAMGIAIVTMLYGSIMAVRDKQIKRRLAYSTASNLSYILFSLTLLTVNGFSAAMTHMVFHAIMKINLFFVAGAIMIYAKKEYVDDFKGLSKVMGVPMFAFLVSSLSMVGIPITCGFISKYKLITSAIEVSNTEVIAGLFAIIISAILTLVYLFSVVINAYIPGADFKYNTLKNVKDTGISMKIVFILLTVLIIYFGVNSTLLVDFIDKVAKGIV